MRRLKLCDRRQDKILCLATKVKVAPQTAGRIMKHVGEYFLAPAFVMMFLGCTVGATSDGVDALQDSGVPAGDGGSCASSIARVDDFFNTVQNDAPQSYPCMADSDCGITRFELRCPDNSSVRISYCELPFPLAAVEDYEVGKAALRESICSLDYCLISADCDGVFEMEPFCSSEGVCDLRQTP